MTSERRQRRASVARGWRTRGAWVAHERAGGARAAHVGGLRDAMTDVEAIGSSLSFASVGKCLYVCGPQLLPILVEVGRRRADFGRIRAKLGRVRPKFDRS